MRILSLFHTIFFTVVLILLSGQAIDAQTRSTYISEMQVLKDRFDVTFVYDSSLPLDAACWSVSGMLSL